MKNPHCRVPNCEGSVSHEDDPIVVHLLEVNKNPALLAGYAYSGLSALKASTKKDIEDNNVFAWLTRSRQIEELYIRALYALLIAKDEELPHFFSEERPNGFRFIYDKVNEHAFAGHGNLHMTFNDDLGPEIDNFSVLDLYNQTAHVSFRSQVLAKHYQTLSTLYVNSHRDSFVGRTDAYLEFLHDIIVMFSVDKTRTDVLEMLRFQYSNQVPRTKKKP